MVKTSFALTADRKKRVLKMKKRQKKQQQTQKVFKMSAFWKRDRRERIK